VSRFPAFIRSDQMPGSTTLPDVAVEECIRTKRSTSFLIPRRADVWGNT
jgi:hypothetical protein